MCVWVICRVCAECGVWVVCNGDVCVWVVCNGDVCGWVVCNGEVCVGDM